MRLCFVIALVSAMGTSFTGCTTQQPAADTGPVVVDMNAVVADMGVPSDSGPCGSLCRSSEVCDPDADGGPRCVGCLGNTDCSGGRKCDLETNSCVACLEDADCTLAATSQCNLTTHTCVACSTNTQCAQFAATPVCATEGCVECTHEFQEACAGNVCDSTQHECTDRAPHTLGLCQECVSDDDCTEGKLCVPTTFGGGMTPVGNYCLWMRDATLPGAPNSTCTAVPPYFQQLTAASVDGATDPSCGLRRATCESRNDYSASTCTGDDDCGVAGLTDGRCAEIDTTTHLCTIPCLSALDCPGSVACSTGDADPVCTQ